MYIVISSIPSFISLRLNYFPKYLVTWFQLAFYALFYRIRDNVSVIKIKFLYLDVDLLCFYAV